MENEVFFEKVGWRRRDREVEMEKERRRRRI
jgi:hypothetical protein